MTALGAINARGFLLLPVTLALLVVAAIALMLNTSGPSGLQLNQVDAEVESARFAAEAGINHGLWLLDQQNCVAPADLTNQPIGGHSYDVSITTNASGTVSTATFTASADASLIEAQPTTNFGSDALLNVQTGVDSKRRSAIRFDLGTIAQGATVVSATLLLYVDDADTAVSQTIHRITSEWSENTVTWSALENAFDSSIDSIIPSATSAGSIVEINLTSLVQAWINNGVANYGLLIRPAPTSDPANYASRDHGTAAFRPQLSVTTTTGSAMTRADITATGVSDNGASHTISRNHVTTYRAPVHALTFQPSADDIADAWITASKLDWNYGGHSFVRANEGAGPQRGLMRFDLSRWVPKGAEIVSARLHLFADTLTGQVDIFALNRTWIEGDCGGVCASEGATWATADGTATWTNAGGDVDSQPIASLAPGAGNSWHSVEITDLLAAWVSGERSNYGVQIRATDGLGLFYTADNGNPAVAPRISVSYRCACGTVCVPPQGEGALLLTVGDADNPSTADQNLAARLAAWGYVVSLISDHSSPAEFDTAVAANDVAYIAASVSDTVLGSKLTTSPIGLVTEKTDALDELALAASGANPVAASLNISDTSHVITAPFATGDSLLADQTIALLGASGTVAAGATSLGKIATTDSLLVVESGGLLTNGSAATARRVMLPTGGDEETNWLYATNSQAYLTSRAINWAKTAQSCTDQSLAVRIATGTDDAEEDRQSSPGAMTINSTDLELVDETNGSGRQLVGMRFRGIAIPPGATIGSATIDFTVDEIDSAATSLTIYGEAIDDAPGFIDESANISKRTPTTATVAWDEMPKWETTGEVHTSPDLSPIIQEIIDRPGWQPRNDISLLISGSGERTAEAFEGDSSKAPLLKVKFCGDVLTTVELLMVVVDADNLSAQETTKKSLVESWGYAVNLIAASATQAKFDQATDTAAVVFVGQEIDATTLGNKLNSATIGVVLEEADLANDVGLADSVAWQQHASFDVVDNSHYITVPFAGGVVALFTAAEPLASLKNNLAPGLDELARVPGGPALVALESGETLVGGASAAGRRVQLPWGDAGTDINRLSENGLTLFRRALEWAAGAMLDVTSGPAAYWALDEGAGTIAVDREGNHDAELDGGTWVSGLSDGGLTLDGSTESLTVPDANSLDFADGFTLMGWVNKTSSTGYDTIFNKASSDTEWNYWFGTSNDEINFTLYNDGYQEFVTIGAGLENGTWYHLAASFDNDSDTVRLYLNGVEIHSEMTSFDPLINAGPLTIGHSTVGEWFDGTLDDLRLFNYALPADEIATLAEEPNSGVVFESFSEAKLGTDGTSISVNKPAGTATGDLLIMTVTTDGATKDDLTVPANWQLIDLDTKSSRVTVGVWWRIADDAEPASYSASWADSEQAYATVMRFSGQNLTTPINATAVDDGQALSAVSPAVTTTVDNALILRIGGFDDDEITLDDSGLTGHTTITMDSSDTGTTTVSSGAGYLIQAAAGDSGVASFALTANERYRVVTLAIAPQ